MQIQLRVIETTRCMALTGKTTIQHVWRLEHKLAAKKSRACKSSHNVKELQLQGSPDWKIVMIKHMAWE